MPHVSLPCWRSLLTLAVVVGCGSGDAEWPSEEDDDAFSSAAAVSAPAEPVSDASLEAEKEAAFVSDLLAALEQLDTPPDARAPEHERALPQAQEPYLDLASVEFAQRLAQQLEKAGQRPALTADEAAAPAPGESDVGATASPEAAASDAGQVGEAADAP